MAQLPPFKSLRKEDFPQAPQWFVGVTYILNQFMNAVSLAFNKNVSFRQNIDCQIFTYTFEGSTPFTPIDILTTIKRRADGVVILQTINNTTREPVISSCSWVVTNEGVQIVDMSNLSAGNQYTVTFLII